MTAQAAAPAPRAPAAAERASPSTRPGPISPDARAPMLSSSPGAASGRRLSPRAHPDRDAIADAVGGRETPRPDADPAAMVESGATSPESSPPAAAGAHYLQARLLRASGAPDRAADHLRLALASDPGSVALAMELSSVELELGLAAPALRRLRLLARKHPRHVGVQRMLGEALLDEGQLRAASRVLERAAKLAPADVPTAKAAITAAVRRGRTAQAERLADAVLSGPAQSIEGWRKLVELYRLQDAPRSTARALRRVLREVPTDLKAWEALGEQEVLADRVEAASEAVGRGLAEARRQGAATGRFHLFAAQLSLQQGRLQEGAAHLDAVLRADEVPQALLRVAFVWLDGGMPERAAEVLQRREGSPDAPRLAYLAGLVLNRLQRFAEAADAFAEASTGHPHAREAVLAHAVARSRAGQHAAALEAFEALIADAEGDPEALVEVCVEWARALERSGRRADAEALLRDALGGPAADASHAAELAALLQRAGRGPEAIDVLEEALRAGHTDRTSLRFALGLTLIREGREREALEVVRTLHRHLPDHPPTLNLLGYALAQSGRDLAEAERLLRRAVELRPGTGAYLDSLGYLLLRTGRVQEAKKLLEEAARREPFEPVILDHLGDALREMGDASEAQARWRRALELAGDGDADLPTGFREAVQQKLDSLSEALGAR